MADLSWSSASAGSPIAGPVFTAPRDALGIGPHPARLVCEDNRRCKTVCWKPGEPCPPMDLPADRELATIEEWLES